MERMGYTRQTGLSGHTIALYGVRVLASLVTSYLFYLVFERNTPAVRRFLRSRFFPAPKQAVATG